MDSRFPGYFERVGRWRNYCDQAETHMESNAVERISRYGILAAPLVGLLCLLCDIVDRGGYRDGAALFVAFSMIALAWFVWMRALKLRVALMAVPPISDSEFSYLTGVVWQRTKRGLKVIWVLGAAMFLLFPLMLGRVFVEVQDLSDLPRALGPYLAGFGAVASVVGCTLFLTFPLARDLGRGALARGAFRRLSSASAVGLFWVVVAFMLSLTPPYLLLAWVVHTLPQGDFCSGCTVALAFLRALFGVCLAVGAGGFATAILIPWAVVWGTKTWLNLLAFAVAGLLGFVTRRFALWLAVLVAYTLLWDTIVCARGQAFLRKAWIFVSGIFAGLLSLLIGWLMELWGLRGVFLPVFAVGMCFSLAIDAGLQRWDTE